MVQVQELIDKAASDTRDFILNDVDLKLVRVRREWSATRPTTTTSPMRAGTRRGTSPTRQGRGGMVGAQGGATDGAGGSNDDDSVPPAVQLDALRKELKCGWASVWAG